jgi:hypothetical protein
MDRKTVLQYAGFVATTLAFAAATTWPFYNAWKLRYSDAYLASHDWVMTSASVGELVGINRSTENDTFPKGGAKDGVARFEHKLVGHTAKATIAVILNEEGGRWQVDRAAWKDGEEWRELQVDGEGAGAGSAGLPVGAQNPATGAPEVPAAPQAD